MKNSKYKQIRFLLLGCIFSLVSFNVVSQEITPVVDEQDENVTIVQTTIPGNLFSTNEITNTGAVSSISGDVIYKTPTSNTGIQSRVDWQGYLLSMAMENPVGTAVVGLFAVSVLMRYRAMPIRQSTMWTVLRSTEII